MVAWQMDPKKFSTIKNKSDKNKKGNANIKQVN